MVRLPIHIPIFNSKLAPLNQIVLWIHTRKNLGIKMILIVDDDQASAENCSMLLELYGYDVKIAFGGKEALSLMETHQLDLLISDCRMPDLDGLELSKIITALPNGAPFPIILVSSERQCVAAPGDSYDAFVRKPLLAENLLMEVRRLLDSNYSPLPNH